MAYRFIEKHQRQFGTRWLLKRMGIFPNAYYNYLKQTKAAYRAKESEICRKIKDIHHEFGWCTDSTYVFLTNGSMRYNCTIIDLYDRRVVASETGKWITSDLAILTLEKALHSQKRRPENLILHSDQGSQFTSAQLILYCRQHVITQSMSAAGCPYDNAPMERYYNTFKAELINRFNFQTDEELEHAVLEFTYVWHNRVRPHSYNDYRTPYEARYGLNQFRQLCYKNA